MQLKNGHNVVSSEILSGFVARWEHLDTIQGHLRDDRKALRTEIQSAGYDMPILLDIVKAKKDPAKTKEQSILRKVYADALQLDLFE